MMYGMWLSAAGLQVNEYRQAVLANNLANAETTGFKQDLAVFRARNVESQSGPAEIGLNHPVLDGLSGGTFARPTYTDFAAGSLTQTSNSLDAAIVGDGFFVVESAGKPFLTRDGAFTQSADGRLVNGRGQSVLDTEGQPIVIPDGASPTIDQAGRVMDGQTQLAQLQLVEVTDPQQLGKAGQNLFDPRHAQQVPFTGSLEPGHLENSTVEPVTLLTKVIEASRAYEMNARMITMQDEMLGRAVNDIARI